MKITTILLTLLLFSGCAALKTTEERGDLNTYVKCKTADVATTAVGLATFKMVEGNALINALSIPALGHVFGTLVPVVGLAVATYYALEYINKPQVTQVVSGIACVASVWNLILIL